MSNSLTWSMCTPYYKEYNGYDPFHSLYSNLRYSIKGSSIYKVTSADVANLPGISFNVYGTVDLWRVILEYNGLSDPINDIYVGMALRIPNKSEVAALLSATVNTSTNSSITI